jgi:hypothetical protein
LTCDTFNVSVAKGVQSLEEQLTILKPLLGPGDKLVIAGYSQGARVVSIAKMKYVNGEWGSLPTPDAFVFIGNPNRPNGGLLSRLGFLGYIPILNVTTGQPTPTGPTPAFPDGIPTEDWAIRWEGIADWPTFMLNPLAVANSILGFYYDHGTYLAFNADSDPGETPAGYTVDEWEAITANPQDYPAIVNIQYYGDTTYYTITPKTLPLVRPLHLIPLIGKPIADLFEPALRVIIEETGYARWIPFGAPVGTGTIPFFNPITLFLKLIPAIFIGINNFLANFGLATEIPLSPTTPMTPSPLSTLRTVEDELDNPDDSSEDRLAVVQDNGDVDQQQGEGDEIELLDGNVLDGDVLDGDVLDGDVLDGDVLDGDVLDGDVLDGDVLDGDVVDGDVVDGDVVDGNEIQGVNDEDPEESNGPEDNTIDANGGSVSLSFSPNQANEDPTGDGEGPAQLAPVADPEPAPDAEGTEGPEGATQAAA